MKDFTSLKEKEWIDQFTLHHLGETEFQNQVHEDVVKAVCDRHIITHPGSYNHCPVVLVESLASHAKAIPEVFQDEEHQDGCPVLPHLSDEELIENQRADPSIREVVCQLETGEKPPPTARLELPELSLLMREWNRLELKNGVLYRRRQEGANSTFQLQ